MVPVHIAPHDTPDRCCFIKNLIFWHTHILEYIKSLTFHDKKSKDNTGLKVGQQSLFRLHPVFICQEEHSGHSFTQTNNQALDLLESNHTRGKKIQKGKLHD